MANIECKIDEEKTVAFSGQYLVSSGILTGWTESEINQQIWRRSEQLAGLLYQRGYDTFLCSLSAGFDLCAASAILSMKRFGGLSNIRLIVFVTSFEHERPYPPPYSQIYMDVFESADAQVVIRERHPYGCVRNKKSALLGNSSMLVTYYDGTLPYQTHIIRAAKSQNKIIFNLCSTELGRSYNRKVDRHLQEEILAIR